jgi:hypothetical protein
MNFWPKWDATKASWWSKARARGRTRSIHIRGVLGWGIPTGLLLGVFNYFFFDHHRLSPQLGFLITFPLVGIACGFQMWNSNENAYQRYLSGEELKALDGLNAKL